VFKRKGKVLSYTLDVKTRYKIQENDFKEYLLSPAKIDPFLEHQLRRSMGPKFKPHKPVHPDKEAEKVEVGLKKIETQASLAMSSVVTQSWLLQYASAQVTGQYFRRTEEFSGPICRCGDFEECTELCSRCVHGRPGFTG
jgi:hypothetical protein